jgi:hypothetical protein
MKEQLMKRLSNRMPLERLRCKLTRVWVRNKEQKAGERLGVKDEGLLRVWETETLRFLPFILLATC